MHLTPARCRCPAPEDRYGDCCPDNRSSNRNPERHRKNALRYVVKAPGVVCQQHGVVAEKADEKSADQKRNDLDRMSRAAFQAVDKEADADHLAMLERMREPEKGCCRHAPGDEIIARRNIDAERPAGRQQHHQHKKGAEQDDGLQGVKADERIVLDHLSLNIAPAEIHALLGTNGTGKSTLASIVMGCEGYRPTEGEIFFDGTIINDMKIHERAKLGIAMAWQEPVRFEGLGVAEYLTLNEQGVDPAFYLEMVGLEPSLYIHRKVDKTLSGGERKRIELASVLALRSRLAILDEPDSGIDMLSMGEIINVINRFKENGTAVLLITHREEMVLTADHAMQICGGRIVCAGNPERVAAFYKDRKCLICDGEVCGYV